MRRSLPSTAAALALLAVSCAALSPDEPTRLRVDVAGLPAAVSGQVTVEGPDGAVYTVEETDEREVEPGTYRLTIDGVDTGGAMSYPAEDQVEAVAEEGTTTTVEAHYEVTVPETTTVLDHTDPGIVEVDGDEVRFRPDADQLPELLPGRTLVVAEGPQTPELLVREIVGVREADDGTVALATKPVPLDTALPAGVVSFDEPPEPQGAADQAVARTLPQEPGSEGQDDDQEADFSFEFGGYQAGADILQDGRRTQTCAAEVPPMRFTVQDFDVATRGRYGWNTETMTTSVDVGLRFTLDSHFDVKGQLDVKCVDQFETGEFGIDKVCKSKIVMRLVRVGPISLDCGVKGLFKGNVVLEAGKVEGKLGGRAVYDFTAGLSGGVPNGTAVESDFTPYAEYSSGGLGGKIVLEAAWELLIGVEALQVADLGIAAELSYAYELTPDAMKVPFKGKTSLKTGLDAVVWDLQQELTLFQWDTTLWEMTKDGAPSPDTSPEDTAQPSLAYADRDGVHLWSAGTTRTVYQTADTAVDQLLWSRSGELLAGTTDTGGVFLVDLGGADGDPEVHTWDCGFCEIAFQGDTLVSAVAEAGASGAPGLLVYPADGGAPEFSEVTGLPALDDASCAHFPCGIDLVGGGLGDGGELLISYRQSGGGNHGGRGEFHILDPELRASPADTPHGIARGTMRSAGNAAGDLLALPSYRSSGSCEDYTQVSVADLTSGTVTEVEFTEDAGNPWPVAAWFDERDTLHAAFISQPGCDADRVRTDAGAWDGVRVFSAQAPYRDGWTADRHDPVAAAAVHPDGWLATLSSDTPPTPMELWQPGTLTAVGPSEDTHQVADGVTLFAWQPE